MSLRVSGINSQGEFVVIDDHNVQVATIELILDGAFFPTKGDEFELKGKVTWTRDEIELSEPGPPLTSGPRCSVCGRPTYADPCYQCWLYD